MIDVGIATAAMKVERKERMKTRTVRQARMLPLTRWPSISWRAARM
jgi:hypothetical protein